MHEARACQKQAAEDTAVHVSLSSDAIVKQRGTAEPNPGRHPAETGTDKDADTPGKPCRAVNSRTKPGSVETRGPLTQQRRRR